MFVCRLSKGMIKHYFYRETDKMVFVSTHGRFLEKDYMMSNRIKRYID